MGQWGDQANTLRRLMHLRRKFGASSEPARTVPVITFSSGKGGVGKSCLAANLGTLLARSGLRTLLVDGDLGLANLDILLGVQSSITLEQVLQGTASLSDALIHVETNLWMLPAASGMMDLREADPNIRTRLLVLLDTFPVELDAILVDVGSGIQENVLSLHHPSFRSVVVLTPEPTSLTDAYGLIKLLKKRSGIDRVGIIVNQVTSGREGVATFGRLNSVAQRFIDVNLEYLGHCSRDENFSRSVMKRKILLDLNHEAPSIGCLELLAKRLRESSVGPSTSNHEELKKSSVTFWRTLLEG